MNHWSITGALVALGGLLLAGCPALTLEPTAPHAHVVYDPGSGTIPLPNDALRDAEAGTLDLVDAPDLTPTEVDARQFLNTLDGWSSVTATITAVRLITVFWDGVDMY